jgi:hypothetical protein
MRDEMADTLPPGITQRDVNSMVALISGAAQPGSAGICIFIGILLYLVALNSSSYPNPCVFRMVDGKECLVEFNI